MCFISYRSSEMATTRALLLYPIIALLTSSIYSKNYFIYQWHGIRKSPFDFLGPGRKRFIENRCEFKNCMVTKKVNYFGRNVSAFDAIIFDAMDLFYGVSDKDLNLKHRSPHQKYIFTSLESEVNFPLYQPILNNFFNWTWTYRLNSDFRRGYITVYDPYGDVVGPKKEIRWKFNERMKPLTENFKKILYQKSELAAWFVSHCRSKSEREIFVNEVQKTLTKLGNYTVDIFGQCGRFDCGKHTSKCAKMLRRDYFFYFAFENSFAADYVTEKLMTALDNYNVPVVYGGANYSRFLPPNSYLNALELGPEALAHRMVEISKNSSAYQDFFRWRKHYVYKETTYKEDICKLCEMMNDEEKFKDHQTVQDFVTWWNKYSTKI